MDYIQGENVTFYANYLNANSTPVLNGISGVTLDIYHFVSSSKIYDLSNAVMTNDLNNPNIYYYNYSIPSTALVTNYNVIYNSLFSGTSIQSSEIFSILPSDTSVPSTIGQGTVAASGLVVDVSGNAISMANVSMISGNSVYASIMTDISGSYVAYLNPGNYLASFIKTGYFTDQVMKTVPSGVTNFNLGTEILTSGSIGTITITDTYVYQTQNLQNVAIPNLKVQAFNNDRPAGDVPVATSYTDANGTFIMTLNPGLYVLTVNGEFWNTSLNKNVRYNVIYNIEVDTHFTNNFSYLDTSKYNYLG